MRGGGGGGGGGGGEGWRGPGRATPPRGSQAYGGGLRPYRTLNTSFSPPSSSLPTQTLSTLPLLSTSTRVGVPGTLMAAKSTFAMLSGWAPTAANFSASWGLVSSEGTAATNFTPEPFWFRSSRRRL